MIDSNNVQPYSDYKCNVHRSHDIAIIVLAFFLYSFVFLLSWTDAFRLGSWLPVYLIPLLMAMPFALIGIASRKYRVINPYDAGDILLVIFLCYICFHAVFYANDKTLNYIMAYFFVFVLEYFVFKLFIVNFTLLKTLLSINALAVFIVGLYCALEFILEFFFSFNIQAYIPRTRPASATMNIIFSRSYGFSTEPTVVMFYMNTLGPLGLWTISKKLSAPRLSSILVRYIIYTIIAIGWLSTFSTSGYATLIVALVISLIIVRPDYKSRKLRKKAYIFASILISFLLYFFSDAVLFMFEDIINKITLNRDYISVSQRLEAIEIGVQRVVDNPLFGIGLGATSADGEGSVLNWYLFITSEIGIIGLIFIALFLGIRLFVIITGDIEARFPFVLGLISGLGYLASLSTFFNPFIWVLLAIHGFYMYECNQSKLRN